MKDFKQLLVDTVYTNKTLKARNYDLNFSKYLKKLVGQKEMVTAF